MKTGLCPDMPFMVNDWLSSTPIACMTLAQEGAFLRLLLHAWNDPDCTLPDDDSALAALSRLGKEWGKGSGHLVRAMFHPDPDRPGRIFNAKQREVREIQARRIEATREQRTAAVNARWAKRDALREQHGSNTAVLRENVRGGIRGDTSSPVSRISPPLSPNGVHPPVSDPQSVASASQAEGSEPNQGSFLARITAKTPDSGQERFEDATPAPAKPRERDPIFDTLAAAEGSKPAELTKSAARAIGVAAAEIRKASPAVTPDEVGRRAANYRAVMPTGTTLTASALAKHWSRCGEPNGSPRHAMSKDERLRRAMA